MSAFVVANGHIDVLINAVAQYGVLDGKDPRELGQMLWRENHRSVNARYGERTRTPSYRLKITEARLHPVAVLRAINCYLYQTCEHRSWSTSKARGLTTALTDAIQARHPELFVTRPSGTFTTPSGEPYMMPAYRDDGVYQAAPWEFGTLEQAHADQYTSP